MKLADVLQRLEAVRPCAGGWVARCPAHSDRNPSLSIRKGDGKVLVKCFAGCSFEAISDALSAGPWRPVFGLPGAASASLLDDAKRTEIALRVWRASKPAAGAPVERYLRARGITIPVPPSLRFHPSVRHPSGAYLPAIVAAVQLATGAIVSDSSHLPGARWLRQGEGRTKQGCPRPYPRCGGEARAGRRKLVSRGRYRNRAERAASDAHPQLGRPRHVESRESRNA